jgi:tRNA (guanine-N7-)-methyltransferase
VTEHYSQVAAPLVLPWRTLPFPAPWREIFDTRELDLTLEVGFGDGRYTVRRAMAEPERQFIALEIASASIQRALRKLRKHRVDNVRLLKVGANFAVQHLIAPGSLSEIIVNFPDPWPKERHEKNRLLQRRFFGFAAARLKPGGTIQLATDHSDYLAFAQAEGHASGYFTLSQPDPPAAVFETKYALKWKTQGKPLYYQVFTQKGTPPTIPYLERPQTMPHALLAGRLPDTLEFDKQVLPYADGHVILHELMRSLGGDDVSEGEKLLLRATIDEPDLRQQLLVAVKRREGGELIVRLEPFGDPIITQTVRGAVHGVTEWLLARSDLQVIARNY